MLNELYNGYNLTTCCKRKIDDRYSVEIIIEKNVNGSIRKETFIDSKITLMLQQEAEKEAINFGKNIIKNNFISF